VVHPGGVSRSAPLPACGRESGENPDHSSGVRSHDGEHKSQISWSLDVTGPAADQWTASWPAAIKQPTHQGVRFMSIRTRINWRFERHAPGPDLRRTPGPRVCPVLRDT